MRKTHISENNFLMTPFLLCSFFRGSDNTTSQNIGGTDAWAVPPPQIWGTVPAVPLGLRPCLRCASFDGLLSGDRDSEMNYSSLQMARDSIRT